MKIWHALTALGAISAGVFTLRAVDHHRSEATLARLRADVAALSAAKDAQLRDGVERARAPAAPITAPSPERPSAPAIEEARADAEQADAPKPRPVEPAEVRDQLEIAFTQERPDPAWAPKALSTAQQRLQATLPEPSTLRGVECRKSMCRIETVHQAVNRYQQFVQSTFMNPETSLWNGGFFTTTLADPRSGELVVVSYLAHEGEELVQPAALQ